SWRLRVLIFFDCSCVIFSILAKAQRRKEFFPLPTAGRLCIFGRQPFISLRLRVFARHSFFLSYVRQNE
ncbi:MAG: hypothetical protein LW824_06405, partial [Algoriphagus sp.]|nr:hypothetical protein [Algoriphagus sp.]